VAIYRSLNASFNDLIFFLVSDRKRSMLFRCFPVEFPFNAAPASRARMVNVPIDQNIWITAKRYVSVASRHNPSLKFHSADAHGALQRRELKRLDGRKGSLGAKLHLVSNHPDRLASVVGCMKAANVKLVHRDARSHRHIMLEDVEGGGLFGAGVPHGLVSRLLNLALDNRLAHVYKNLTQTDK
jgi:hypothetical protein